MYINTAISMATMLIIGLVRNKGKSGESVRE
jgi:hypothetical protein